MHYSIFHDDVIKWKHFPRYWPSPHKGQWHGALMFSLICAWINRGVNNREANDLRRYRAHYNVIVMHTTRSAINDDNVGIMKTLRISWPRLLVRRAHLSVVKCPWGQIRQWNCCTNPTMHQWPLCKRSGLTLIEVSQHAYQAFSLPFISFHVIFCNLM